MFDYKQIKKLALEANSFILNNKIIIVQNENLTKMIAQKLALKLTIDPNGQFK